jgi:hypothetical protein
MSGTTGIAVLEVDPAIATLAAHAVESKEAGSGRAASMAAGAAVVVVAAMAHAMLRS